jgi:NTE family protein
MRLPTYRRPKVGLALGGGGARGYAHIGVLQVLEREGVPVDLLAGTSMGGVVAACYAAGLSVARLEQEALTLRPRSLLDVSLFRTGVLEGKRVREHLVKILGDTTFEQTRIPVRLVALDLDSCEDIALGQGALVDAVRATVSMPGVFCPAEWQGRRLVDGGVTNNVPADVARQMGAEVVIAVDVIGEEMSASAYEELNGGLFALPGVRQMTPMLSVLIRSVRIMRLEILRNRLAAAHPDVLIRPDLGTVRIEDFGRAAEAIPAGERAAEAAMPQVRALLRKRIRASA